VKLVHSVLYCGGQVDGVGYRKGLATAFHVVVANVVGKRGYLYVHAHAGHALQQIGERIVDACRHLRLQYFDLGKHRRDEPYLAALISRYHLSQAIHFIAFAILVLEPSEK
jgi:hypothetical protein